MKNKFNLYVPIRKKDSVKRLIWGYATTESEDSQGEIVERDAVVNAWDDYMKWANIREMHQLSAVGKTKEYMHDDKGTWIVAKIVDDNAWKEVMEDVYMGFSIGGSVLKKSGNKIKEIVIDEISVVDRGSNPDTEFQLAKRDNTNSEGFIAVNRERESSEVDTIEGDNNKENMSTEYKSEEEINTEETEEEVKEPEEENKEEVEAKVEENLEAQKEEDEDEEEEDDEEDEELKAETEEKIENKKEEDEEEEKEEETEKAEETGDLKKDVSEMRALSEITSELDWLARAFKENGRNVSVTSKLDEAIGLLMQATRNEAKKDTEKAEEGGNLMKTVGEVNENLEKYSSKVGELEEKVTALEEKLSKSQDNVNKPKTTYTVEKEGTSEEGGLQKARSDMKDILEKIDKAYDRARELSKSGDAGREAQVKQELGELQKEYSQVKRVLDGYKVG